MARTPTVPFLEVLEAVATLRASGEIQPSKYRLRQVLGDRPSYGYLGSCLDRLAALEAAGRSLESLIEEGITQPAIGVDPGWERLGNLTAHLAERLEPLVQELLTEADLRAARSEAQLRPQLEEKDQALSTAIQELAKLRERVAHLEQEKTELTEAVNTRTEQLQQMRLTVEAQRTEIAHLSLRLTESNEQTRSERDRLEREREAYKTQLRERTHEHQAALTGEQTAHQRSREAQLVLQQRTEQLAQDNARLLEQLNQLRQQSAKTAGERNALQAKVTELATAVTAARELQREAEFKAAAATQAAADLRMRIADLEATRTQLTSVEASVRELMKALPTQSDPKSKTQKKHHAKS